MQNNKFAFDQWGYPVRIDSINTIEKMRKIPKYMRKTPDALVEELWRDNNSRLRMLPYEVLLMIINMKIQMEISDHKKQWIHDNYMCNICEKIYMCFVRDFCRPGSNFRNYRKRKKRLLKYCPHEKHQICAPLLYILKKPRKMPQRDYISRCRARDFLYGTSTEY